MVTLLPFLYSGQDTLTLLEKAQKRGSLTILTRNGASSYFIGPEGGTGLGGEVVVTVVARCEAQGWHVPVL